MFPCCCLAKDPGTVGHKRAVVHIWVSAAPRAHVSCPPPFFLNFLCFGTNGAGRRGGGEARDQTQIISWYPAREIGQVATPHPRHDSRANQRPDLLLNSCHQQLQVVFVFVALANVITRGHLPGWRDHREARREARSCRCKTLLKSHL